MQGAERTSSFCPGLASKRTISTTSALSVDDMVEGSWMYRWKARCRTRITLLRRVRRVW